MRRGRRHERAYPQIWRRSCAGGASRPTTARWRRWHGASSVMSVLSTDYCAASLLSGVSNEAGGGRRTTSCSRPSSLHGRTTRKSRSRPSLLEDARPGRVDAVVFGTVARRDGVAVLRGRRASVLLKAHAEAYDLPLNASVAIDGCGLRKRPRDQSHQIPWRPGTKYW